MAKQKTNSVPMVRIKKGDSLRTIYAKARRAFSAADLQEFADVEEGVPARQVLAELEALDRKAASKSRRKKRA
jgi:hypothetical protein